jgi:hypothetical protein
MTPLEQLRIELDKYEAAHGTTRRHPDGRLESRQMIALIGRAVLEMARPSSFISADESLWRRGAEPGELLLLYGDGWETWTASCRAMNPLFREACAVLWPDFVLPDA